MKIENIIRRVLREEQEEEKLFELLPIDDFFDNDWNLALNFMNRYPNKKFYYPGDLDFTGSKIKTLGNLVRVEGDLNLIDTDIETLGKLERVEGNLDLKVSDIKSLGNLVRVEGNLDLTDTDIETLGNLEYVGGDLDLGHSNVESLGNLKYVGSHLYLLYTLLSEKYTEEEIRDMVEVIEDIVMEDDGLTMGDDDDW